MLAAQGMLAQGSSLPLTDYAAITRGGVCVVSNWLDDEELSALRRDFHQLLSEGAFQPSGLSVTTVSGLSGDPRSAGTRLVCESHPNEDRLAFIESRLDLLRLDLERALDRTLTLTEQYFSYSPAGVSLAAHMDERHEETKGESAWLADSRRSVSWLLYLSNDQWGEPGGAGAGGNLRAFCRRGGVAPCGAHEGNLQVGWLESSGRATAAAPSAAPSAAPPASLPVFLDAWLPPARLRGRSVAMMRMEYLRRGMGPDEVDEMVSRECQPNAALYCLGRGGGARQYLTEPIAPSEFGLLIGDDMSGDGMEWADFSDALRQLLPAEKRERFSSVALGLAASAADGSHDSSSLELVEVRPAGGTLVLFDSVAVPHQVGLVQRGERLALAGWFHEPQQDPPEFWTG